MHEDRTVGFCRQLNQIFYRNLIYLLRNPRTFQSAIINSLFLSVCFSAIFYHSAQFSEDRTFDRQRANWIGVPGIITNNITYYGIFVCILQMPMWVPIMKRELMNKMYSPTTYYFGRILSGLMFQLAYPAIISILSFWFYGIHLTAANFFMFFFNALGMTLNGCCIGYTIGILINLDENARIVVNLIALYLQALSGVFNNIN